MSGQGDESGFALVEACAALGVLALVVAMFMGVMQSSFIARERVAETREATMVARSQLAFAVEAARGGEHGRSGPYAWRVAVSDFPSVEGGPGLEQISVRVSDKGSGAGLVELRTVRLAR